MRSLTPEELNNKLLAGKTVQIIDTRPPDKYAECHIKGAINIPSIDLPDKSGLIDRVNTVVIYCQYGVKSDAPFIYIREKLKIRNVYVLEGGLFQWAADIEPDMPVL